MTETCWLISEENHGTIGVATSMLAGKQWLIDSAWVTEVTDVRIPQKQKIVSLKTRHGEEWKKHFLSYDEGELENMGFFFREMELYREK